MGREWMIETYCDVMSSRVILSLVQGSQCAVGYPFRCVMPPMCRSNLFWTIDMFFCLFVCVFYQLLPVLGASGLVVGKKDIQTKCTTSSLFKNQYFIIKRSRKIICPHAIGLHHTQEPPPPSNITKTRNKPIPLPPWMRQNYIIFSGTRK